MAKWSRSGVFMRTEVLVISYPILQCAMSYFILPSLCCPPSHLCCLRSEPNSDVSLQPEPFDEPDQFVRLALIQRIGITEPVKLANVIDFECFHFQRLSYPNP